MAPFTPEELGILSTLAYYQALDVPSLTAMEILRYWTPWGTQSPTPSFLEVIRRVDALARKNVLQIKNGYVALAEEANFFHRRIEARKQGIEKRRICFRFARMLPYIPFVRMAALTGSLATDNADEESDIDILIGSQVNRIWTTRILVTMLFHVMGKRRHGNKIKNRICLNHYVALESLRHTSAAHNSFRLIPQALTTAHIYVQATPLWGIELFQDIKNMNSWLDSYVGLTLAPTIPATLCTPNAVGIFLKMCAEKYLHPAWALVEQLSGSFQKKHVLSKIAGKSVDPLEISVGDTTLLFHYPFSRSKYALTRYRQRMKSILQFA